jgi:hypothetical protein
MNNMKKLIIPVIITVMLSFIFAPLTFSQQEQIKYTKPKKKDPRSSWSLGLNYGENGFGPYVNFFSDISRSTDLTIGLSISGVSDNREIERYDVFGNSVIPNKINRVFMMPLSIGIKSEVFKDDLEGDFHPVFNLGLTPTLVITDPYDQSFFNALNEAKTYFAFGGYTGIGVNFASGESTSFSFNFNYYYLPIIGGGVQSVEYNTINNVGGFQLAIGVNFLK